MYYVIENPKMNGAATDEPLTVIFMTNPPQRFQVPATVLHEALNNYLKKDIEKGEVLTADIPKPQ